MWVLKGMLRGSPVKKNGCWECRRNAGPAVGKREVAKHAATTRLQGIRLRHKWENSAGGIRSREKALGKSLDNIRG